ncbi:MAG: cytochrome c [Paludibacter sp.]
MYNRNIKIVALTVVSVFFLQSFAQNNWNVPADKKVKNSYIKFDAATIGQGQEIYTKNCISCHGDMTKGNSMKSLNPIPPDLSTKGTQSLTDGELFYILSTGRAVMPNFSSVLSEEERWKVIAYIRSFNKSYVQVVSKFDPNKAKLVKLSMNFDPKTSQVKVDVKANEKTGVISVKDAEVGLFVTRYFGKLQIQKNKLTDANGQVAFDFPKDIPGDKTGTIELVVKLNDDNYGEIETSTKLQLGVATDKPALTDKRAIWGTLAKAPFWIILLYSAGVLAFGAVLLYLIFALNKIRKSGNNKQQ